MNHIYLVPGILGSELKLGKEKLWPPSALDVLGGISEPERLLSEHVEVGEVLRDVLTFGLYGNLLDQLADWGYNDGTLNRCVPWGYNWTKSIPSLAEMLSNELSVRLGEDDRIILLGHSMGGLVCTYALECLEDNAERRAWRNRVKLLITFGTPFYGSPEALKNAFGLEGFPGIKKVACHNLMADPRFLSAYQLLPHLTARSSWSGKSPLRPLSKYTMLAPDALPLNDENVQIAMEFQESLANATPNPATRKFNFCGSDLKTIWGAMSNTEKPDKFTELTGRCGDGTVPSWSGRQNQEVQFAPLGTTHRKTFDDPDLLEVLEQLLLPEPVPSGPGGTGRPEPIPSGPGGTGRPEPIPSGSGGTGRFAERKGKVNNGSWPRITLAKDVIPVGLDDVFVQLLDRPRYDYVNFAWVNLGFSATVADAGSVLENIRQINATESVFVATNVDIPLALHIKAPLEAGIYALVAWCVNDDGNVEPAAINQNEVPYLLYFNDEAEGENGGNNPHNPQPPQFASKKTTDTVQDEDDSAGAGGYAAA